MALVFFRCVQSNLESILFTTALILRFWAFSQKTKFPSELVFHPSENRVE